MNISLTPQRESFVKARVQEGRYGSADSPDPLHNGLQVATTSQRAPLRLNRKNHPINPERDTR